MENRFHERAIKSGSGVEGGNHCSGYDEGAESGRTKVRWIEFERTINI